MLIPLSLQRLSRWLTRGRNAPRADRFRRRLSLEYLEDRTVPATLFVRGDQPGPGFPDLIDLDVADSGGVRVTLNGDVTEYAPGEWTDVRVESGGGNDVIHVLQTANGVPVSINSTGNARVIVGASGSVQGIQAGVTITNSIARTAVEVDDSADALAQTLTLSSVFVAGGAGRRFAFSGAAPIDARDSGTRSLTVDTGTAGAQVNVQTNVNSPVALVVHADNTDVSVTSGVIALNGPQTVRNVTLAGGELRGTGDLTIAGTFTWTGGTLGGPGRTVAQGTMLLSGGDKLLTGRTLVNAGTATWGGGDITASHRAALTNQLGALFDIQSNASFTNVDGTAVFTNFGTVRKSAGTGTTRLAVAMNNAGGVEVNAGILSVSNGSSSGSFAVAAGATLQFLSGTYLLTASSDVSGDGRILFGGPSAVSLSGTYNVADTVINGGTASFDGDASTGSLTEDAGTFTGAGTFSVNGLLTWNSGFMSGTGTTFAVGGLAFSSAGDKILADRTLDNFADAAWTGGAITISRPAVINNFAGAVFDIRTDLRLSDLAGDSAFNNAGTLRKSAGVGVSQLFNPVNNTGAVEILTGTLELWGGGTGTGSFTVQAGATLTFVRGDFLLPDSSTISGGGDVRFTGGTAYVLGSYAVAGGTTVSGTGTAFFFTAAPAVMGSLTIDAGTAAFFGDATAGALTQSGGLLTGSGALTVTGLTTWTGGFVGGGGRTVARGGLRISNPGTKVLDDRTIDNEADAIWSDGFLRVTAGVVINNLAGATFDIQANGGTFDGRTPIFNNFGTLRKSAGIPTVTFSDALTNAGTVDVRAGTLSVGPAGFLASSTGAFMIQNGATLVFATAHPLAATVTFAGAGLVRVIGPVTYAGDLSLSANSPAFTVVGTLTVTGTFTQTGGSTMLAGGTLSAAGGVSLQGGTLSGSGTIVGNVTNAALIVVGDATTIGALSITGNYTQTVTGSLTQKLGGTAFGQFDRLVVSSMATLAGTLTVRLVNGYMPAAGDTLRVLTAGSLTGTFGTLAGDGALFDPLYDATGLTLRRR
jgi:hypothetical protein